MGQIIYKTKMFLPNCNMCKAKVKNFIPQWWYQWEGTITRQKMWVCKLCCLRERGKKNKVPFDIFDKQLKIKEAE